MTWDPLGSLAGTLVLGGFWAPLLGALWDNGSPLGHPWENSFLLVITRKLWHGLKVVEYEVDHRRIRLVRLDDLLPSELRKVLVERPRSGRKNRVRASFNMKRKLKLPLTPNSTIQSTPY
eukprot:jgi/Botrbrau1/8660/Bobra.0087s0014.1